MKPDDLTAAQKMVDELTGADRFRRSAVEQQIALAQDMSRKLAESTMGFRLPAERPDVEIARQIAIREHQRLRHLMLPTAATALSAIVRNLQGTEAFNVARFTAANAVAQTVKAMHQYYPHFAASFHEMNRRAAAESVAAISSVLSARVQNLEDMHTRFARDIAETLRITLGDFEERNKEAFLQLQQSLDDKIDELPAKLADPTWKKILDFIVQLVAIAGFALMVAQQLDDKKEAKKQAQIAVQVMAQLQQVITNTERLLNTHYEVIRPVKLKERPDHRAKTLTTIPKGESVRLIEKKHKWVKVEYVEDSDEGPIHGWVAKKYLRRVS
jgi:SH3 domain-containing protein